MLFFCATLHSNVCMLDDLTRAIVFAVTGEGGREGSSAPVAGIPTVPAPIPFMRYATGSAAAPAWAALGREKDGAKHVRVTFQARVESFVSHRVLAARLQEYVLRYWGAHPLLERVSARGEHGTAIETNCYDTLARLPLPSQRVVLRAGDFRALCGCASDVPSHAVGVYDWAKCECVKAPRTPPALPEFPFSGECQGVSPMSAPLLQVPTPDHGGDAAFEGMPDSWPTTAAVFPKGSPVFESLVYADGSARCPYAGAEHGPDPSGGSYVCVNVSACRTRAHVDCRHPGCYAEKRRIVLDPGRIPSESAAELDRENLVSLHSLSRASQWDEVYEESAMRPLPVKPIVVVRANMGVGKTRAIEELLERQPADRSVLAITFSKALAAKAAAELAAHGFVHFLSAQGDIVDARVVVCLDSICRVARDAFDFVILDEAVSTFLHLNSSVMRSPCFVVAQL
jgi:hypothetical protein